jgi:hypothetical protein
MALPVIRIAAACAAGYYLYKQFMPRPTGSTTNASDAVDDIELRPDASLDDKVDAAVKETFPASDPDSVNPAETAYERKQRERGA